MEVLFGKSPPLYGLAFSLIMETALYLIPTLLGDTDINKVLPAYNRDVILGIRHL